MRVHKATTATAVVAMAIGGLGFGAGAAFADGRGASAAGGSAAAGGVFQQNTAQEARQNNNCAQDNPEADVVTLTGTRAKGRCVTVDGSFNHRVFESQGGADAQGGSAAADAIQQNTAQRGRQNNNCDNPNQAGVLATGGRLATRCVDLDASRAKDAYRKGGGAKADGGSNQTVDLLQQNTAQEGRQNNNCASPNSAGPFIDGGRNDDWCGNKNTSAGEHTVDKGSGAQAEGGSGVSTVDQQNTAQEGRQNNNCVNPGAGSVDLTGGRAAHRCGNEDASLSKYTHRTGGGANARSGGDDLFPEHQNTAQEGRQNNNCANPNSNDVTLEPGRAESRCGNKDVSFSKYTSYRGGGADAEGGSGSDAIQQNTAQEGQQNNNCSSRNGLADINATGGRVEDRCANTDASFSKHTSYQGGGADADGGSTTGATLEQQTVAQEGRQNNNCANANGENDLELTGARAENRCANADGSFNRGAFTQGGGAHADSGSSAANVAQQNVAQEGRQNNNCANPQGFLDSEVTGGRQSAGCGTADRSANVGTSDIGGGAEAEGGSATADLLQQNVAQEGRQNNDCANPNNLDLTSTGSRTTSQCLAVDRSRNVGTQYR
ncbi:hypothetical protein [Streptomyces sp. NPDC047108]|uniref:hypothetical protein n=1 Tax=Streptomyces sp. NPDC047108 TaxID=3155025 RepID=UPI0033DC8537